jgi:hypothetical protein
VSTAEEHERPGTVLRGRALPAARAVWVALVATVLALFITGIPASYRTAHVLRPETVAGLERLGVPTGLPATYLTVLDTVTMLGFAGIAVLILARRSDDWIAMLMALTQPWCAEPGRGRRGPTGHTRRRYCRKPVRWRNGLTA